MPRTRFVIAAHPHTGSNLLCGVLNSHPGILCHDDALHPEAIYYARKYRERSPAFQPSLARRNADPRRFVADLFACDLGHEAIGLKLMHGHEPLLAAELLRDPSVRKIVLRRENRVRVFLSMKRATRADGFANTSYRGMPVEVDPAELREFCRAYDGYFAWLDRHLVRQHVLRLTYERLFDRGEISRVVDFLDVERVDESSLEAKPTRQSSDRLPEAISNFSELERRFARTELAAELAAA
jgi:hypothetical protein